MCDSKTDRSTLFYGSEFDWTGTTYDHSLRVGDILAHVEQLSDDVWFLGIYCGPDTLLHSSETEGVIKTGEMARAIAEAVVTANIKGGQKLTQERDDPPEMLGDMPVDSGYYWVKFVKEFDDSLVYLYADDMDSGPRRARFFNGMEVRDRDWRLKGSQWERAKNPFGD